MKNHESDFLSHSDFQCILQFSISNKSFVWNSLSQMHMKYIWQLFEHLHVLVVFYVYITIYSLWNVIQKKENSIFHTFMILHFFQTCIETSSHIPYFELFKKSVFIFCARAYMQMQNWTKIYRCNVEKIALKTGIFFTKKKFCTYYSEIRGLCSMKCSID